MNFFTQFSTWTGKVWALLPPINHQLNFMAPFFTLEYVEFSSDAILPDAYRQPKRDHQIRLVRMQHACKHF